VNDVEHQVQKAICDYLDLKGICYWAVPNGGSRNLMTGKKLKSEGVKPGVPDLTVILPGGKFLALEVKKPKTTTAPGRLSKVQKRMIKKIQDVGGQVEVVYSLEEVIKIIDQIQISVDEEYKYMDEKWWKRV
jgi:hypothetical protein